MVININSTSHLPLVQAGVCLSIAIVVLLQMVNTAEASLDDPYDTRFYCLANLDDSDQSPHYEHEYEQEWFEYEQEWFEFENGDEEEYF